MAALQVGIHTNNPDKLVAMDAFNCVYACTKHDSLYNSVAFG